MAMDEQDGIDWTGVDGDMAGRILHQGELYLAAQLQTALAADQRAMTTAGILIGFATAIIGATLAYYNQSNNVPLLSAGLTASTFMLLGSFCCLYAARPVDFTSHGSHPNQWWDLREADLAELMGGEAENYQTGISENARTLNSNASWLYRGMRCAVVAPILALIVWSVL